MLNLFLIAAAVFAFLGMVSLVWAPSPVQSPSQPSTPSGGPVKLVAKNPQPNAEPSELDRIRKFLVARDYLHELGNSIEDIEAMAEKRWKSLLLKKVATNEA